MTDLDVRERFKEAPMGRWQIAAALFCAVAIVADGYDTVSMSLAAPFVISDLGLAPKSMGIIFSAMALGMVAGAFIGAQADRIGRRTIILGSCGSIAVIMLLAGLANSMTEFVVLRFLTGCGVGAMVTTLNVLVMEYSSRKRSSLYLAIVHVGIGTGAILGSIVASQVIEPLGWRWIFFAGSIFNVMVFAVGWFLLPESPEFLFSRQPKNALVRVNAVLARFGQATVSELPTAISSDERRKLGFRAVLAPALLVPTLLLALASFAHFAVAYFHNSWTPKLLIDAGVEAKTALAGGIVLGVGSLMGNLLTGYFCGRFEPRRVVAVAFVLGAIALLGFGVAHNNVYVLLASAGLVSLFSSATNTGVYLCAARFYPAAFRGSGVGTVAGLGRIGAVIGPYLGGALIGMGWERSSYYPIFAGLWLIGGVAIALSASRLVRLGSASKA